MTRLILRLAGALLLSAAAAIPAFAQATGGGCLGTTSDAPAQTASDTILVATPNCTIAMSADEYRTFLEKQKRLPDLPDSYVFGHTIPKPAVDQNGRVHVAGAPTEQAQAAPGVPAAKPTARHSPHTTRPAKSHPADPAAKPAHSAKAPPDNSARTTTQ